MKKEQRQIDSLSELLKEQAEVEKQISSLPCGYISVKKISGQVYNYRQWRNGNKIISEYVPDAVLNIVKRRIATRKWYEEQLKAIKKEICSTSHKLIKNGTISEEEIKTLKK